MRYSPRLEASPDRQHSATACGATQRRRFPTIESVGNRHSRSARPVPGSQEAVEEIDAWCAQHLRWRRTSPRVVQVIS